MIRYPLAAAVVLVAILVTPEAAADGVNSADLILTVCPFLLVAVVGWPRRSRRLSTPVELPPRGQCEGAGESVPAPSHTIEGVER